MSNDPDLVASLLAQITALSDPIAAGRAQLARPVPIEDWAAAYRAKVARTTESENTVATYNSTIDLFTRWVLDHDSLVSKPIIEGFLADRMTHARTSAAGSGNTWNRHLSVLRSMFTFLVGNQMDTGCPTIYRDQVLGVERMDKPLSEAHPLATSDALALLNAPLAPDERFWLGFCYFAGLRRFEVSSLQVGQIDTSGPYRTRGLVHIRRKGKRERRFANVPYGLMGCLVAKQFPDTVGAKVELWFKCIELVVAERGPDPTTLACVRADDRSGESPDRHAWVDYDFRKLCLKYGVTNPYKVHDLRDSCSTNLSRVDGLSADDRMRFMAHQDKATNDLYTKFEDDRALALLD